MSDRFSFICHTIPSNEARTSRARARGDPVTRDRTRDRDAELSKYNTFAYTVCVRIDNPLIDKRIVAAPSTPRVVVDGTAGIVEL